MTDNILVKLDIARTALMEAKTIQETKHILDVAATAEVYAKRQKLGEEAISYATAIKVEALRQLGNMLKETPRNTGDAGRAVFGETRGAQRIPRVGEPPTLEEMGLDKRTSKLAQDIASLPEEQFDAVRDGVVSLSMAQRKARSIKLADERKIIADNAKDIKHSDQWNIYHADMETWKAPRQYDFIITDPPYPKEYLHLYETLAIRANEWLRDGGLLIAMCGQSYLNEIYKMMDNHLKYYWTSCYLTLHQPTPLRQRNVNTTWKPLLVYAKGEYKGKIFGDVYKSPQPQKSNHDWEQSIDGMSALIKQVCLPGQYILDPFNGSGTTGIAAIKHGCLYDGVELELESVNISKGRIHDAEA